MSDQKAKRSRTLEGRVRVWEQEGGYCAPDIQIDEEPIIDLFEEVLEKSPFELERAGKTDPECAVVRVTVELLESPKEQS